MEKDIIDTAQAMCTWTPEIFTEFLKAIIWPITVIVLAIYYRSGLTKTIINFLERNNVKELKAGSGGISATFEKADQNIKSIDLANSGNSVSLEHDSFEAIQKKHTESKTEFSEILLSSIRKHVDSLGIDDSQKIELLTTEVSLLQSAIQFFQVNKAIFRSQYELLSEEVYGRECVTVETMKRYFKDVQQSYPEGLGEWDYVKYLSYPLSVGLLISSDDGYKLSKFGKSYIDFMRRNIQFIDELSNL